VRNQDPFDLIRAWLAAFNRGDLDTLAALYHDDAEREGDRETLAGREALRAALAQHFAAWQPAFEGGGRRRVRMVARVENGPVHAEWVSRERDVATGEVRESLGRAEFDVEDGRIRRHRERSPARATPDGAPADQARPPSRLYPPRPVVGVGGVVIHEGRVVLIKRKYEPLAGHWSLPGGTLELGETLEAGVAREVLEETGLVVEVGPLVEVFDRILLDTGGRVRFHFVLVDYLCRVMGGELRASSDVADAIFADPADLPNFKPTAKVISIVQRAIKIDEGARVRGATG
jgi:8-oxo-dGTP diphosphatase